jgi:flagellar export protein FliJ
MKRFKFSLQAVHDFREFQRDAAEREFADANTHLQRAEAQLEEVQQAHRRALNGYSLLLKASEIEATMIAAATDYLASLVRRERELRDQIAQIQQFVETKRLALTEAARDTRTTAKLRERQLERHESEGARKEQNMLDEMAVAANVRRRITI